jgi:hypothetical protein
VQPVEQLVELPPVLAGGGQPRPRRLGVRGEAARGGAPQVGDRSEELEPAAEGFDLVLQRELVAGRRVAQDRAFGAVVRAVAERHALVRRLEDVVLLIVLLARRFGRGQFGDVPEVLGVGLKRFEEPSEQSAAFRRIRQVGDRAGPAAGQRVVRMLAFLQGHAGRLAQPSHQ